jgi:hypothetical protein
VSAVEHHDSRVQAAECIPVVGTGFQQVNQVIVHGKSTLLVLFYRFTNV